MIEGMARDALSLHPISLEDALRGAMQVPASKAAKPAGEKRRLKPRSDKTGSDGEGEGGQDQ
jgi:hypothetical protein